VCEIDKTQQQMSNQIDISAQILERVVKDQAMLARQLDATSQEVARLTLDRPPVEEVPLQVVLACASLRWGIGFR
jgi:hypothetical protein